MEINIIDFCRQHNKLIVIIVEMQQKKIAVIKFHCCSYALMDGTLIMRSETDLCSLALLKGNP